MATFKRTSRLQPGVKRQAKYTADKVGGIGLRGDWSGQAGRRSGDRSGKVVNDTSASGESNPPNKSGEK
jgi:hypothetical protein